MLGDMARVRGAVCCLLLRVCLDRLPSWVCGRASLVEGPAYWRRAVSASEYAKQHLRSWDVLQAGDMVMASLQGTRVLKEQKQGGSSIKGIEVGQRQRSLYRKNFGWGSGHIFPICHWQLLLPFLLSRPCGSNVFPLFST